MGLKCLRRTRCSSSSGGGKPTLQCELGLLRLIEGEFRAAATSLRHGFVPNGYVAEMICGTPDPLPVAKWHGSSLAGPDSAMNYVALFGELWQDTSGAVAFVRWLHTRPDVMAECAEIQVCDEELLCKRHFKPIPRRRFPPGDFRVQCSPRS